MNMKHATLLATWFSCLALCASALAASPAQVRQLEWETLLPANERGQAAAPPPPTHDYLGENSSIAAMQSGSFEVNPELNGVLVKVPGFVVPLQSNAAGEVNEFFLVPYFGACIRANIWCR